MSNDTIKRSDAIKALDNAWINGTSLLDANEAVKQLKDLPSADRPTGKWILSGLQSIEKMENGNYYYYCSNCLHVDAHAKTQEVPYCWYCGAKMEGVTGWMIQSAERKQSL